MTGTPEGAGPVRVGDEYQALMRYEGKVIAELKGKIEQTH